ncbi:MAG TPA: chorismate lyase [Steroidobacteraceae bacterium]|jgi:chorismate--pyruvate lyase|nr:chorismate lyase [Steroidobacteraceae bacterium]
MNKDPVAKNAGQLRPIQSVQWLPAERLGRLNMDSRVRSWLLGKGLTTLRMKSACGERFAARLVDQWSGKLEGSHLSPLRVNDGAGLFRDVELCCGDQVWVFEQSIIPDSTLTANSWLAELGDTGIGETLASLSKLERSSYEYAWLPVRQPVTARALREAEVRPAGLWTRRHRVALRGAPLLIQELFLPVVGRT